MFKEYVPAKIKLSFVLFRQAHIMLHKLSVITVFVNHTFERSAKRQLRWHQEVEGEMERGQSEVRQEVRKASANCWIFAQISTAILYSTCNTQGIHSGIKPGLHKPSQSLSFSLHFRDWEKSIFSQRIFKVHLVKRSGKKVTSQNTVVLVNVVSFSYE